MSARRAWDEFRMSNTAFVEWFYFKGSTIMSREWKVKGQLESFQQKFIQKLNTHYYCIKKVKLYSSFNANCFVALWKQEDNSPKVELLGQSGAVRLLKGETVDKHPSAPADGTMRPEKQNGDGVKTGKTGKLKFKTFCFPSGGGNVLIRHLL